MYLDALGRGGVAFEEGLPAAGAEGLEAVALQAVGVAVGDDDEVEGGLAPEGDAPPGGDDLAVGVPAGAEIVVVGKVVDGIVVAPRALGGTVLGEVAADDGGGGLGEVGDVAGARPQAANLFQGGESVGIHEAVAVGGDVEDEGAVGVAVGLDVVAHELGGVLEAVGGEAGLPEPAALQGQAGEGGQTVLAGADALACALFVGLDVGVEEGLAGVFGSVEVHDEAVGLERLDVAVDVLEGDVVVGDAAPGGVPAVDDEGADGAVVGEQLGELVLDQLDVAGLDAVGAQTVVGVEDGVVEIDGKALGTEGVGILAHDVAAEGAVHDVIVGGLGVPDAEAAVVLGGEAAVGHVGGLGGAGPLAAVELRGVEEVGRGVGVGPVLVAEGGHVEMDEHAEAAVDELLLKLVERRLLGQGGKGEGEQHEGEEAAADSGTGSCFHTYGGYLIRVQI